LIEYLDGKCSHIQDESNDTSEVDSEVSTKLQNHLNGRNVASDPTLVAVEIAVRKVLRNDFTGYVQKVSYLSSAYLPLATRFSSRRRLGT